MVTGRLRRSSWTGEDGTTRTAIEVDAEEVGASLKWATDALACAPRTAAGQGDTSVPAGGGTGSPWDVGATPSPGAGRPGQPAGPGLRAVRGDDGPPPF